jgi:hypothetical protein
MRKRDESRGRAGTQIVRVSLWGRKSIYRDIEIVSTKSLYDLAAAIVRAFGFDFDHPFGFYSGMNRGTMMRQHPQYELFADIGEDSEARSVKQTTIAEALPQIGCALAFLFDYGDEWLFRVEVIGTGYAEKGRYPKVIAKKGDAPPQYPEEPDLVDEDE